MNGNIYAVIMGFNNFVDNGRLPSLSYAEKDAQDLYDLLVDPKYGNCPQQNIALITGSEIRLHSDNEEGYTPRLHSLVHGEIPPSELGTSDIETILYTQVVKDRTDQDIVIVYYSGHGFFAGKNEKGYLATPDISVLTIENNPKAGLQMEYLRNDIFLETKAKVAIFLLDCCYSGALCFGAKEQISPKTLIEQRFFSGEGRVVIASSPADVISRESKTLKNGVFTRHLLEGLQGNAREETGEVTISSLISYVQRMMPSQRPQAYGNYTRIILTKPQIENPSQPTYKEYAGEHLAALSNTIVKDLPLQNPLEEHVKYIHSLMDCLKEVNPEDQRSLGNKILSAIRCSTDAEFAFIQRIEEDHRKTKVIYKYESDLAVKGMEFEEYKQLVMADLLPALTKEKKELLTRRFGLFKPFEGRKQADRYLVAIPLRLEYPREFLVICGLSSEALKYGEVLGRALISVYYATREFAHIELVDVESALLDDLKKDFGQVPLSIYQHRYELFNEKLGKVRFAFEPIICLSKRKPEIQSWEALARDPDTQRAPFDLFNTAELWGAQFITQLDLYCLHHAVSTYNELWSQEPPSRKMDPLSVNVYPDTIFRSVYKKEIGRIVLKEELISKHKLTLEISEKRPLPKIETVVDNPTEDIDPVDEFIQKICEYINEFQIRFAIDDFGIERSSVARLAKLKLDHVKIDRDILQHSHPEHTIRYVNTLVESSHPEHPIEIIIEGYDGDSRISLKTLYDDLRINYVQGHMIRRAEESIRDLNDEETKTILDHLVKGKTPN